MEAAYITYDRNGGNFLDETPQGKLSLLFQTLLNHFDNDRAKAIVAKSNVYSDEFAEWFGDWWGPLNVHDEDVEYGPISKVVDENGEPLIVWHASKNTFDIFDKSKIGSGLGLIDDDPDGFYFSEENIVKTDQYKITYPVYLNI